MNSYATVDNSSTNNHPHTSLNSETGSDILTINSIDSTLDLDSSNNTTTTSSNTLNGSNSSTPSPTSNVLPADSLPATNDFGPHTNYKLPPKSTNVHSNNANASIAFIQAESSNTKTSQEEVDPKSQLANKTIFKSNNPNLSIIEINENSIKDNENSVFIVDGDANNSLAHKDTISQQFDNASAAAAAALTHKADGQQPMPNELLSDGSIADKRRNKAESLIQTSKQKLNIAIAEASAAETASPAAVTDDSAALNNGIIMPQTKREIKIYDTLEEFEKNLPSTVTVLDTPFGSKVYLVGTAHFSEESQDDVSFVSTYAISCLQFLIN